MGLTATALAYWQKRGPFIWVPVVLAVVAFAVAPYNATAVFFFLFAAGMFPWAVEWARSAQHHARAAAHLYAEWVMLGARAGAARSSSMWLSTCRS